MQSYNIGVSRPTQLPTSGPNISYKTIVNIFIYLSFFFLLPPGDGRASGRELYGNCEGLHERRASKWPDILKRTGGLGTYATQPEDLQLKSSPVLDVECKQEELFPCLAISNQSA